MPLTLPTAVMQDPHKLAAALAQVSKHRSARLGQMYKQRAGRQVRVAGIFSSPTEQVGATTDGRVNLYYDPSLGQQGLDVANAILPKLDKLLADNDAMFAATGKSGNIIILARDGRTDGLAGAVHGSGGFNDDSPEGSDWYEDVAFGNPDLTFGLVQAEVTESYMGLCYSGQQSMGWNMLGSNGEALSRFLAQQVSGGPEGAIPPEYGTGPAFAQAGFPNFIDATYPSDQDAPSTGCGIVYIYWMVSQGFTPTEIVQAGCPDGTLASNFKALTGQSNGWGQFKAALDGLSHEIQGDDPWSAAVGPGAGHPKSGVTLTIDPIAKTITAPAGYKLVHPTSGGVAKPHGGHR